MKKWLLIGAAALAAILGAMKIFSTPHVIDVTKEYEGEGYFGRRFETRKDFLVLIGDGMTEAQLDSLGGGNPEKKDLPAKYPMRWHGEKIMGLLPAGSHFRVVGARRSTSSTMGNDYFVAEVESDGPFKGKQVCTRFIGRYEGKQIYASEYAVELTTGTGK